MTMTSTAIPALFMGIMFGLSAGFAPGPLTMLVIRQTLRHNTREGMLVASAPILTDLPIILMSYFVLDRLTGMGLAVGAISAIGGLYVLYLSYETLRTVPVRVETSSVQARSLRRGVLVNFLNPHPYLFWGTVGVPFILKAWRSDPVSPWAFLATFYALLVGSKVFIALIVGKFRTFLEGKVYLYIMRGLGVILACFGLLLLRDAFVGFGFM
jgi:threonine/homoserine/homoserine lactone efflux protein